MIYILNLSKKDFLRKKNKHLYKIWQWVTENDPSSTVLVTSLEGDEEHVYPVCHETDPNIPFEHSKKEFINKLIKIVYKYNNTITFYTAGEDEVRAWQIYKGSLAPQAAGSIHTEFERGFISAQVIHFDDLRTAGSERNVVNWGKSQTVGKLYTVEDGDVLSFKFL